MASKILLTTNEIEYLIWATHVPDGFLDFENNTEKSFKKVYGFSMNEAEKITKALRTKLNTHKKKIQLQ